MTTHAHKITSPPPSPGVAEVEQHPLGRSIALHLVPGILTAIAYYALGPVMTRAGYPAIAAGVLAAGVFIVGGELGWLLREAHRRTGTWSIRSVLPFRPEPFTRRKGLPVVALFVWAFSVSLLQIGSSMKDSFFSWMPEWTLNPISEPPAAAGVHAADVVTAIGFLLILVILGPFVEELYFRGYLLPRIGRFGAWAALINVSLFALYHLWKPWDAINLILVLAPMVYAVWRTKDIRISIALHIALNSTTWLLTVAPTLLLN